MLQCPACLVPYCRCALEEEAEDAGRVIGAAFAAATCVERKVVGGERESEPRERRKGWESVASVREGRKESSEREGGERRDHVLPQRPRGAEDTFIMHRASEPAEPRGVVGHRRSTLPRSVPAPRMRRASFLSLRQGRAKSRDYDLVATTDGADLIAFSPVGSKFRRETRRAPFLERLSSNAS